MSLKDDLARQGKIAKDAVRDPALMKKIMDKARDEGISFNQARDDLLGETSKK